MYKKTFFFIAVVGYILFSGCQDPSIPASLILTPSVLNIEVGEKQILVALLTPKNQKHQLSWVSEDPDVATVNTDGQVTGVNRGVTRIRVTSQSDKNLSGVSKIYVDLNFTPDLNTDEMTMTADEKGKLTLSYDPPIFNDFVHHVTWSSGDENVATVDPSGVITAEAPGETEITAEVYLTFDYSNVAQTALCHLTVKNNELIKQPEESAEPVEGVFTTTIEKYFYFNGAAGSTFTIYWKGDVSLSAYHGKTDDYYFENDESAGDITDFVTRSIDIPETERVYLKITPLEEGTGFSLYYTIDNPSPPQTWTFLIYLNPDGGLDPYVLSEIGKMLDGYHKDILINVVILIDKEHEYSEYTIQDSFLDTRLYMITASIDPTPGAPGGKLERIWEGGDYFPGINSNEIFEANMGSWLTLRQFIDFGKNNFPAARYALLTSFHGFGPYGFSRDSSPEEDLMHPGEISAYLSDEQSVNLLGFHACLMGSLEVAYQFRNLENSGDERFHAEYLLASPNQISVNMGWGYKEVFQRININPSVTGEEDSLNPQPGIQNEMVYSPDTLDAQTLGNMFVEETKDYGLNIYGRYSSEYMGDSLINYNLAKIPAIKGLVDDLAISLFSSPGEKEAIESIRDNYFRGEPLSIAFNSFAHNNEVEKYVCPIFEIRELCEEIVSDSSFSTGTVDIAGDIIASMDQMTEDGYAYYMETEPNTPALSLFFTAYNGIGSSPDESYWKNFQTHQWWYTPNEIPESKRNSVPEGFFGNLNSCRDRVTSTGDVIEVTPNNGTVENWFELLDAWYYGDPDGVGPLADYNGYLY